MKVNLGIETAKNWLKIVAARPTGKDRALSHCFARDISSLSENEIVSLINDTLKNWQIKAATASLSIPRNLITLRNLHLPSQDKTEIAQMVQLHIGKIVPYSREEIIYNYCLGGVDEMGYSRIVLGILHRNVIDRQMNILEKTNIFIDRLVLSSYEIWRRILHAQSDQIKEGTIYLSLDIDEQFTDFIVFSKDELLFSRSIATRSRELSEGAPAIVKLVGEIKQSLVIFQNEEMNRKPEMVFLSGAGINITGFSEILLKELDIPVHTVDKPCQEKMFSQEVPPFLSFTSVAEAISEAGSRRVVFVVPELEIKKSLQEKTRELIILGSALVYFFTLFCGIFAAKIYQNNVYLEKVREKYRSIGSEVGEVEEAFEGVEAVKGYLNERRIPFFFLSRLQDAVSPQITLSSVRLDKNNKATLKGEAEQLSDVFNFTNTLAGVDHFENVETKSTKKVASEGREQVSFEIILEVK